ncbi:hypothetical protein R0J90_16385, partial [Micrococcus sp. SIMBA_144]
MAGKAVEYQLYVYTEVISQRKFASDDNAKTYFMNVMKKKDELRGLIKKKSENGDHFHIIDGIKNEDWD